MMHNSVATFGELRHRTSRFAAAATAVLLITVGASRLSGQVSSRRHVEVTVTDPLSRFVIGLEQERFEVLENGVRRAITGFSNAGAPLSLAVVSDDPLVAVELLGPADDLIQTPSLSNALRQLAASKNSRKVIVTTTNTELPATPSAIQIFKTNPANLLKAVIEVRNQYRIEFESSTPSATVEVALNQPLGLPRLKLNWK